MREALAYILSHRPEFYRALGQHLLMCGISMSVALIVGVSLSIVMVQRPGFASAILNVINGLRSLPSLAVLAIMMPILGIGLLPAVVALTVLALPPILLNSYVGLRDADPDAVAAAVGIGMSPSQLLFKVRVLLAAPAMFAGARTAAVQVLAGATLAPFIGGGGLGDFIVTGLSMMSPARMLVGAVPIAILALGAESMFSLTERRLFARRVPA